VCDRLPISLVFEYFGDIMENANRARGELTDIISGIARRIS